MTLGQLLILVLIVVVFWIMKRQRDQEKKIKDIIDGKVKKTED
jgi:preprotein translocase subunit YajC